MGAGDSPAAQQVEARLLRGLALWREVAERIEQDAAGYWLVPSGSREDVVYRVSPRDLACTCEDHRYSGHIVCKHAWAVRVHLAYVPVALRQAGAHAGVAA